MHDELVHDSDCALHDDPPRPCDCGAEARARRQFVRYLYLRACTHAARLRNEFRYRGSLLLLKRGTDSRTGRTFLSCYRRLFGIRETQAFLRNLDRMRKVRQSSRTRDNGT